MAPNSGFEMCLAPSTDGCRGVQPRHVLNPDSKNNQIIIIIIKEGYHVLNAWPKHGNPFHDLQAIYRPFTGHLQAIYSLIYRPFTGHLLSLANLWLQNSHSYANVLYRLRHQFCRLSTWQPKRKHTKTSFIVLITDP